MFGILALVLIPAALGVCVLGAARSRRPLLQRHGPWLVGAVACLLATLLISASDDGFGSLFQPVRQHQTRDMFITAAVMAVLAVEAVLISRWVLSKVQGRSAASYLVMFTCTTVVAWFLTALAAWDFVPGS
jgi:hypothetical protein